MKANRRLCAPFVRPLLVVAVAALSASCAQQRIIPAPRPAPAPPPPPPAPPPSPSPSPQAGLDWREAPITPGDWSWSTEGDQSVARFAGGELVLRCDRAAGRVSLLRAGAAPAPQPITITTTSGERALPATPQSGSTPALVVTLGPGDPALDAMAFSRGRFAVEAPGLAPLYVPSWPEISRVTEDCR